MTNRWLTPSGDDLDMTDRSEGKLDEDRKYKMGDNFVYDVGAVLILVIAAIVGGLLLLHSAGVI